MSTDNTVKKKKHPIMRKQIASNAENIECAQGDIEKLASYTVGRLDEIDKRVEALESKPSGGNILSSTPSKGLQQLREFVKATWPDEYTKEQTPDKKAICAKMRDAVPLHFSNCRPFNLHAGRGKQPSDAFVLDNKYGVDFCKGSSDPGSIKDALQFIRNKLEGDD